MKRATYLSLIVFGLFGICIFLSLTIGFTPHDYFYKQNPGIEKYVGVNVVSAFANLSFFTYHSLIAFSLWLIAYGFSNLLKKDNWIESLTKSPLIAFICLNFFVTCILYTVFELTSGNPTFGLYATTPSAIYNFIINIIVHYLYSFGAVFTYIKVKISDAYNGKICKKNVFKLLIPPTIYLFVYYLLVKITGMYCYKIEWYPYPIFDLDSFGALLGMAEKQLPTLIILILTLIMIWSLYCFCYILLINCKRKNLPKN